MATPTKTETWLKTVKAADSTEEAEKRYQDLTSRLHRAEQARARAVTLRKQITKTEQESAAGLEVDYAALAAAREEMNQSLTLAERVDGLRRQVNNSAIPDTRIAEVIAEQIESASGGLIRAVALTAEPATEPDESARPVVAVVQPFASTLQEDGSYTTATKQGTLIIRYWRSPLVAALDLPSVLQHGYENYALTYPVNVRSVPDVEDRATLPAKSLSVWPDRYEVTAPAEAAPGQELTNRLISEAYGNGRSVFTSGKHDGQLTSVIGLPVSTVSTSLLSSETNGNVTRYRHQTIVGYKVSTDPMRRQMDIGSGKTYVTSTVSTSDYDLGTLLRTAQEKGQGVGLQTQSGRVVEWTISNAGIVDGPNGTVHRYGVGIVTVTEALTA